MTTTTTGRWGPWTLDPDRQALTATATGGCRYAVDLLSLTGARATLDAVCSVARWSGAGPDGDAAVAGFIRALVDVLSPQSCLCSWSRPRNLTRQQIRELVSRAAERPAGAETP